MSTVYRKFLVHHTADFGKEGHHTYWNLFIFPNHYNHSLKTYKELLEVARKTFPDIKEEDCECQTVRESGWCKGMPIIRVGLGRVPTEDERKTFDVCENRMPDVNWG